MTDEATQEDTGQSTETPTETPQDFDFRPFIPDDMREAKFWENVPDTPTLVKNYGEQQKLIGASIRIPKEDAPPEEWGKLFAKLGRPDSADAYELPELGENTQYVDEVLQPFKDIAHREGLTNKQFRAMVEGYMEMQGKEQAARQQSYDEVVEVLTGEWGAQYDRNVGLANRAALTIFGEDVLDAIDKSGIGNLPGFIKGMVRIGKDYAEDGIISGAVEGTLTPDEALSKANEIMQDPAYLNRKDPKHNDLVRQVEKLFQQAYGNEPA